MNKCIRYLIAAAPLAVAIVSFSRLALANWVSYGSAISQCQFSDATGTSPSQLGVDWQGLANRSSTANMYIDCADTFSWENTSIGDYVVTIQVDVYNASSTQNVACDARVLQVDNTIVYSGARKSTSGVTTGQGLIWTGVGQYGISRVSCFIPKAVGSADSGVQDLLVFHN